MSGARALAAARRRRAGPVDQPNVIKKNNTKQQQQQLPPPPEISNQVINGVEQSKPKMTPTQMLLHHNTVLDNLQIVVTDLNEKVENQTNMTENKLSSLSLDDNNIEFFKNKINTLERELSEIKKHILKVQTFAMETNLQCIEIKKKYETNVISNEEQLKNSEEISGILNNN